MSTVYISGPMTGYPEYNARAFRAADDRLRDLGHQTVCPLDVQPLAPTLTWEDYLRADLIALMGCYAVAVLPGWQASRGAVLEVHVAHALGMSVLPIEQWEAAA